jgi:hypothetical protein
MHKAMQTHDYTDKAIEINQTHKECKPSILTYKVIMLHMVILLAKNSFF